MIKKKIYYYSCFIYNLFLILHSSELIRDLLQIVYSYVKNNELLFKVYSILFTKMFNFLSLYVQNYFIMKNKNKFIIYTIYQHLNML